jgi:hypothetical protein
MNPTDRDIEAFSRRFHEFLTVRPRPQLKGITTDGSSLYSEPIVTLFVEVPHQVCTFPDLRDVTKVVLGSVAHRRKDLAMCAPNPTRGRPGSKAARAAARRQKRIEKKVGELFEPRYLFARHRLSVSEWAMLRRISRGSSRLSPLLHLMEEGSRLFDRRCRTATASAKLTRLRRLVRLREDPKKLFLPHTEKAFVFLDEKWMGATSNAVERGYHRFRKMNTVYRVRRRGGNEGRLALDLQRERQAQGRDETSKILQEARAACADDPIPLLQCGFFASKGSMRGCAPRRISWLRA